ncbi:MAG TPA: site-specific integrase [Chloroflexota bacterium]|nr:site-specific integrase [Chloroflexota bacterium]
MTNEGGEGQYALAPFVSKDPRERAFAWAALPADERRRRAVGACQERDHAVLAELLAGYLLTKGRARAQVSPHTLESYSQSVTSLLSLWPEEQLLHPSPDAGDRYAGALSAASYSAATVASRLAGAKALYRALRWTRATTADPFSDVRAPRDPTPRHERRFPYSDADVSALVGIATPADRVLVLLCAHGGLRIAEALALQWVDVDLPRGRLRVTSGKGRKARTVSLSATLAEALRVAPGTHPQAPVVAGRSGEAYADPTVPRRRLRRLCERAGVTYMGFHSLRHSAGTRLARQTGNLQLVAAHLGHADVSTAAIYAKWSDDTLKQAVRDW